jgi:DNA-binding transcriptional LysR family regulator
VQLDWLETFVVVSERGGFGAAASALFRSQPRVSAHIAALENELGTALFDRSQRPVALTVSGQRLYEHARAILNEVTAARASVVDLTGQITGRVVIGTYASAGASFLPAVLRRFRDAHPHVDVRLVEQAVAGLDSALAEGTVDLAVRPMEPASTVPGTHHLPLWRERMKVVVAGGHPLTDLPTPLPAGALAGHSLIIAGFGTGGEAHRLLRERGIDFSVAFVSDQPTTLVALARAGLGVGFINSLGLVAPRMDGVQVLDLADAGLVRDVGVYWRDGMYSSPPTLAMHSMIVNSSAPEGTSALDGLNPNPVTPKPVALTYDEDGG